MKRNQSSVKTFEPKKLKTTRITPSCATKQHMKIPKVKLCPIQDTFEIFRYVDQDDNALKTRIISTTLDRFLKNRPPINVSFTKFLRNFHRFSTFSLLCAHNYMETIELKSKGDVRTFIYVFLGFNILSTKYIDDYCVWNSTLIQNWGLTSSQALQLEIFALKKINYNLEIDLAHIREMFYGVIHCKEPIGGNKQR